MWYHLPYFVLFSPQNMDKSVPNNTRYPPFSGPGTLGHKILHCILREELLEFAVKLCSKRLVVTDDQRGLLHSLYNIGHGEGLAGACDAHQRLSPLPLQNAVCDLVHRLRLVAHEFVIGYYLEFRHTPFFSSFII